MTNNVHSVWKKVRVGKPDECWPWRGYLSSGRGRIDIGNAKGVYAHRAAFVSKNPGSIPLLDDGSRERCVCHKCDNPICCNPDHLFLGTHQDNMDDKVTKGRQARFTSTGSPRAKLSAEDVLDIRAHKQRGATIKALQMLYEVSKSTICGALYGRHYKDIG